MRQILRHAGWLWLPMLLLVLGLAGCSHDQAGGADGQTHRLLIVTSIYPLADMAVQIGGDRVQAEALLPAGASEHAYEPVPADARRVAAADLIILVGQGVDRYIEKLLAAYPEKPVEVITKGMELQPNPKTLLGEGGKKEAGEEHADSSGYDPHVWLDPVLVRDVIAPMIATRLQELDPEGAGTYRENLKRFQEELGSLDRKIRQQVETFSQRKFIVFHSAWHYFARRYGLEDINVEEFPNQEPSAKELMEIVALARDTRARAIFAEPQFSPNAARIIAGEFGGQVLTLDPLGGADLAGRDTYVELMQWNLSQLAEGLK